MEPFLDHPAAIHRTWSVQPTHVDVGNIPHSSISGIRNRSGLQHLPKRGVVCVLCKECHSMYVCMYVLSRVSCDTPGFKMYLKQAFCMFSISVVSGHILPVWSAGGKFTFGLLHSTSVRLQSLLLWVETSKKLNTFCITSSISKSQDNCTWLSFIIMFIRRPNVMSDF